VLLNTYPAIGVYLRTVDFRGLERRAVIMLVDDAAFVNIRNKR
jgi:hypothetical protein